MKKEKKLDKDINVRSKLTDEEIIKALDCMSGVQLRDCDNCPFMDGNFCDDFAIARNALDLIHRLQDENERLKDENIEERDIHFKNLCGYKDEIARLEERAKLDLECEKKWGKLMKEQAVKDTAKEFAETLKTMAYQSTDWSHGEHPMVVEVDYIDELAEKLKLGLDKRLYVYTNDDIDEICKEITESK